MFNKHHRTSRQLPLPLLIDFVKNKGGGNWSDFHFFNFIKDFLSKSFSSFEIWKKKGR